MRFLFNYFAALAFLYSATTVAESASMTMQSLKSMQQAQSSGPRVRSNPTYCSQFNKPCASNASRETKSWKQTYDIHANLCKQELTQKGCYRRAANDASLKGKLKDCSPYGICMRGNVTSTFLQSAKGCFWNAPKAFDVDIWEMISGTIGGAPAAVKNSFNKCYGSPQHWYSKFYSTAKCSSPLYYATQAGYSLGGKISGASFSGTYNKAMAWLKTKKVDVSCYSPEAQAELACYAILNVIVPVHVLKEIKFVPKIVQSLDLHPYKRSAPKPKVAPKPKPVAKPKVAPKPKAVAKPVVRTPKPVTAGAVAADISSNAGGGAAAKVAKVDPIPTYTPASFTDNFVSKEFATEAQNQAWIDLASSSDLPPGTKFFDAENSAMKPLNDTTLNKNFVTALTNQHKQILMDQVKLLEAKYPGVEFVPYSDFKSVRYALKPKPPAKSLPIGLQNDMATAFQKANTRFVNILKANDLVPKGQFANTWFRSGFGGTADEAAAASRYSRQLENNQMQNFAASEVQESLGTTLLNLEESRKFIDFQLGSNSKLLSNTTASGKRVPNESVFEAARKTETAEEMQRFLSRTTGENISIADAQALKRYTEYVDEFSPAIHVAKRELASLAESKMGGFSIDFAGLGAYNGRATAEALARSGGDIKKAIAEARVGEQAVTTSFKAKKQIVEAKVSEILKRNGIDSEIVSSGDDMVVKPKSAIPVNVRAEIAEALAKEDGLDPSSIRMSHVGEDIPSGAERNLLATIGEACEKMIRKFASSSLSPAKLKQVLIMVEVKGTSADKFSTNLVLGQGKVNLTPSEISILQQSSEQALAAGCK